MTIAEPPSADGDQHSPQDAALGTKMRAENRFENRLEALPIELLQAIASHLDWKSWASLAFTWKYFLVHHATALDPNNAVRQQLRRVCKKHQHFQDMLARRLRGPYMFSAQEKHVMELMEMFGGAAPLLESDCMQWLLQAGPEFFLAFDAFTMLDRYRQHHMHDVVTIKGHFMSRSALTLIENVLPQIQQQLQNRKIRFEIRLDSRRCARDEFTSAKTGVPTPEEFLDFAIFFGHKQQQEQDFRAKDGLFHRLFTMTHLDLYLELQDHWLEVFVGHLGNDGLGPGCGGLRKLSLRNWGTMTEEALMTFFDLLGEYPTLEKLFIDIPYNQPEIFGHALRVLERSKSLRTFNFSFTTLREEDLTRLSEAVQKSQALTKLVVWSSVENNQVVAAIANALGPDAVSKVKKLKIQGRLLSDAGAETLLQAMTSLKKSLKNLELPLHLRGTKSMPALAQFLHENSSLEELKLVQMEEDDGRSRFERARNPQPPAERQGKRQCLASLFQALETNCVLRRLNVDGFTLTPESMTHLAAMLRVNTALEDVILLTKRHPDATSDEVMEVFRSGSNRTVKSMRWPFGMKKLTKLLERRGTFTSANDKDGEVEEYSDSDEEDEDDSEMEDTADEEEDEESENMEEIGDTEEEDDEH